MNGRRFVTVAASAAMLMVQLAASRVTARAPGEVASRVTRLEITSRQPAFGGKSFGAVGPYELLLGRAHAVADPRAAINAVIADIDKAPRNADGLVEYSFDIHLLKPVDITKGNKVLFYEFNNRGLANVLGYLLEGVPWHTGIAYEEANIGNGFLMNAGYTVVMSGWQTGARPVPKDRLPAVYAQLPVATENGQPIVGTSREEWIGGGARTVRRTLTYAAASLDQAKATLTVRQNEADPRRPVPATGWSFVDDMTIDIREVPGTDAGTLFEFIYQAKNPPVMGLGFAAVRDFVSFLRSSAADDKGVPNPLFAGGKPVLKVAVSTGTSQSGRAQRDFLYLGFNADTSGHKVFDGMNPIVGGGRRTYTNHRFSQPGRFTRQHEDHLFPMGEFPFTYATTTDPLTGRADGLFQRCAASKTCPKVIQVDSESEPYQGYSSLLVTDTRGRAVRLPNDVRYYVLSTAHLWYGNDACRDPGGHGVVPFPYYRAAYEALVRWARDGVTPPPTKAPSVADGTFVTVSEQGKQYPAIPNRPYNPKINEVGIRDFSVFPPTETAKKYPLFVPRLDADGNLAAGVLAPEIVAPLGTRIGKETRAKGFAEGEVCDVVGSFSPFAKTRAERLASGDSRLSLEERYPRGGSQYAEQYKRAVEKLVAGRYLLPDDGRKLIAAMPPLPN